MYLRLTKSLRQKDPRLSLRFQISVRDRNFYQKDFGRANAICAAHEIICSWWHWLLFVKSAISSFCIQLQDRELQQSKLEVCKAHLTTPRLSQKWIKQSLKQIVSSTFENRWEHEQSFLMTLGLCIDLRFPITAGASAGISSSGEEFCHQW